MKNRKMKCIAPYVSIVLFLGIVFNVQAQQPAAAKATTTNTSVKVLKMVSQHKGMAVGPTHPDVIAANNKAGFETGQIVKIKGMLCVPPYAPLRKKMALTPSYIRP